MSKSKNIVGVIILTFLVGSFVFAGDFDEIDTYHIQFVSQSDLVELACYRFQYEASEAFASVEALNELLVPLHAELKGVLPGIGDYRFIDTIKILAPQIPLDIDKVCSESQFVDAMRDIQVVRGRTEWLILRQTSETFKTSILEKINAETKKIEDSIRDDIESEAKDIKEAKEAELRQKAKDIEAQKRKELNAKIEALKVQARNGQIESLPDNEADIPAFVERVKAKIKAQVDAEAASLEADLKRQMDEYLVQFEADARSELEAKAQILAQNKKDELSDIKQKFESLDIDLNKLITDKKSNYDSYKEKYVKKRVEILQDVVLVQFEEAKGKILDRSDDIDYAISNGVDVPTAGQLVKDLQQSVQDLLDYIASNPDITLEEMQERASILVSQWSETQRSLQAVFASSSQFVVDKVREILYQPNGAQPTLQSVRGQLVSLIAYYNQAMSCKNPKRQYTCEHQDEANSLIERMKSTIDRIDQGTQSINNFLATPASNPIDDTIAKAELLKDELNSIKANIDQTLEMQKTVHTNEVLWWQEQ